MLYSLCCPLIKLFSLHEYRSYSWAKPFPTISWKNSLRTHVDFPNWLLDTYRNLGNIHGHVQLFTSMCRDSKTTIWVSDQFLSIQMIFFISKHQITGPDPKSLSTRHFFWNWSLILLDAWPTKSGGARVGGMFLFWQPSTTKWKQNEI